MTWPDQLSYALGSHRDSVRREVEELEALEVPQGSHRDGVEEVEREIELNQICQVWKNWV